MGPGRGLATEPAHFFYARIFVTLPLMLLPFLWIAAFLFSLPLVEPYEIARLLAVTCAVFAAGLTVVRHGVPSWSPVVVAGALFWALAALSAGLSDIRYLSFVGLGTFSLMPLSALAFAAAPERALRVAGIVAGVMLGALALWAVAQFVWLRDMLVFGQVRWPFASPNSYAALLAMGVFPALGVAAGLAGWRRMALLALAVLLAAAVVVIGSRAVTFLLLPAGLLFVWMTRGAAMKFVPATGAVLLAALAMGLLVVWGKPDAGIMRFLQGDATDAFFGRGPIWQAALAMAADHAVHGTGIGTFSQYYPAYRLAADTSSGGYMVHNDPLQFAVEMGLAGPVLFYAFLLLAARRTMRAAVSPLGAGVFCALGLAVAHAHVDFDFYVASILCLAGLMLAVWYRETGGGVVMLPRVGWLALVPLAGLVLLLQGLLIADNHVRDARGRIAAGDMDGFAAHINAAADKGFGMNAQAYVMAAGLPIGSMHGARLSDRPALYAQAAGLLDKAQARNPRTVSVPYYRAQLAALHRPDGDPGAEEWLRRGLALNPQHTPSRLMLSRRLRGAGQKDAAYEVLCAGLDWTYGTAEAHEFYEELGVQALLRQDMATYGRMTAAAQALDWRLLAPAPAAAD